MIHSLMALLVEICSEGAVVDASVPGSSWSMVRGSSLLIGGKDFRSPNLFNRWDVMLC